MLRFRTLTAAFAAVCGLSASPAGAIVGGRDAAPGQYPFVAHVVIDRAFQCTGTLVAPSWVVTAGHCTSLAPGGVVNVPIGQPGQLIEVSVGPYATPRATLTGYETDGERRGVSDVYVNPGYTTGQSGHDVSLLRLSSPSTKPPVKVAGPTEKSLWAPGTLATIAGFGVTREGGDQPAVLQEARVPIVTDAYAAAAYPRDFENRTQVGAGYDKGGVDTCQGDSGGPLLVPVPGTTTLRLAGDTSYGDGCAQPKKPGIYGRLGDDTLRNWIASIVPEAVAGPATTAPSGTQAKKPKRAARNRRPTAAAR